MQTKKLKIDILDLIDGPDERVECTTLTLWVPVTCKEKYDRLQSSTRRRFGRKLKRELIKSIESVET